MDQDVSTRLGPVFGFAPLPWLSLGLMALVVLAYARSAELPKPAVYRRHKLRDTSLRRHVA